MSLTDYIPDLSAIGQIRTEARRIVCHKCPIFSESTGRCEKNRSVNGKSGCGCFIKPKSTMPKKYCPLGKWENGIEPKENE
jgi:hypothetical protein